MSNLRIASLVSVVMVSTFLSPSTSIGEVPHAYILIPATIRKPQPPTRSRRNSGKKGHWVSKSFRVSCGTGQGLSDETYVRAAVGSKNTDGDDCFGSYLQSKFQISRLL